MFGLLYARAIFIYLHLKILTDLERTQLSQYNEVKKKPRVKDLASRLW